MSGFIERVDIAKMLLVQDMNLINKYKDKKIEDIELNGMSVQ